MSRLPSVFSSRLGGFVRRTRRNELELQTVGSTSLERQIQALFGSTQVENLPPSLQQIIAQDRALAGGGGSGPLTLVNPFTNDDLTPDQQKAAANQMALQQGANPPFPEVQQPQEQDSVVEAGRRAAASVQPLVRDGLLTPADSRGFVRSAIVDTKLNTQRLSKATEDARAVLDQRNTGQITQQAANLAIEDMRGRYGQSLLNNIEEWRELDGTEKQFRARVREGIKTEAAKWPNLPPEAFRHDPRTDEIVANEQWDKNKARSLEIAAEEAKPVIEANNAARKAAQVIFDTDKRQLEKQFQANSKSDPVAASNIFGFGLRAATTVYQDTISSLNAPNGAAVQLAPQPVAQPQAPTAVQGLPPGVALFGAFPDVQSVINASPPTGSYFTIRGLLGRRRLDGRYEPVQ